MKNSGNEGVKYIIPKKNIVKVKLHLTRKIYHAKHSSMNIEAILKDRRVGPAQAAREIGISRQSLYLVRAGRPTGRKVAQKLVAWDSRINVAAVLMGKKPS